MAVITPTITTDDPHVYREQMDLIASFAGGVHIDFADGVFAPTMLLPIDQAWRTEDLITHAHIMYKNPLDQMKAILKLGADLVILHAESENLKKCLEELVEAGVRTGIALLPETPVSKLDDYSGLFEYVLLFEGHLGYQGGEARMEHISKAQEVKAKFPEVELAWDGGANDQNVKQLVEAGVDIINVGGFIKNAEDPQSAYDFLTSLIQS